MPPIITDEDFSDVSDGAEDIMPAKKDPKQSKKAAGKKAVKPADDHVLDEEDVPAEGEDNDDDHDQENEDEDEDVYVVEKILSHAVDDDGVLKYEVKWEGYEAKADRTWEPAENLEGIAALAAYHKRIKGKPVNKPATPAPKRGRKRKSPPAESIPDVQSIANNKKRKPNGPTAVEMGLPTGSWEDDIESIINMEQRPITVRGKQEEDLLCYVKWNDGRRITHSVITLRQKCPQKLLDYLLSKVVFKAADGPEPES